MRHQHPAVVEPSLCWRSNLFGIAVHLPTVVRRSLCLCSSDRMRPLRLYRRRRARVARRNYSQGQGRRDPPTIAWATSLPVSKAHVAEIAAASRARWKKNETFNVIKNHGYELEPISPRRNISRDARSPPSTSSPSPGIRRSISSSRPGRWPASSLPGWPSSKPWRPYDPAGTAPHPENQIEPRTYCF
jgi:hypothetical protein